MAVEQTIKAGSLQRPVNLIEIAQRDSQTADKTAGSSFKQMFSAELAEAHGITFSRHAHERMFSRGLEMSEENLAKLASAVDRAQSKGSKETLVMSKDLACVVNVPSRTVVTVFDSDHLRDGIVTSIDSAVII
jgi:flagellar operon protein